MGLTSNMPLFIYINCKDIKNLQFVVDGRVYLCLFHNHEQLKVHLTQFI